MNSKQEKYIRKIVREEVENLRTEGLFTSLIGNSMGKKALKKLEKDPEYQELKAKVKKLDAEIEKHEDEFNDLADDLGISDKFKF